MFWSYLACAILELPRRIAEDRPKFSFPNEAQQILIGGT